MEASTQGGWPPARKELEQAARRAARAAWEVARARGQVQPELADLAAGPGLEVEVILAGDARVRELNARWRGKDRATNVLSFPMPADVPLPLGERHPLGVVVLAGGVMQREARDRGVSLAAHLAWMVVHGFLHLLGHDHQREEEAMRMEALEAAALARLGLDDPRAGDGVDDEAGDDGK